MELKKPETFEELLETQQILNESIPKLKTEFDIILALDDDNCEELIPVFLGYEVDRNNPGVRIEVL